MTDRQFKLILLCALCYFLAKVGVLIAWHLLL
jgi:hypothetical protein